MTVLNNAKPKLYEKRRCHGTTKNGGRCKAYALCGFDHCWQHMEGKAKEHYNKLKNGEPIPAEETRQCNCIVTEKGSSNYGERCKMRPIRGWLRCFAHLTPLEKQVWRRQRRANARAVGERDYYNGRTKPTIKARKTYDGHKSTIDGETVVQVKDGEVYGFYGGAFLNASQRKLFQSAPVGDIDEDIKVIRYLIKDALENQLLYTDALARGDQEGGFVIFSKDVSETVDDDGRVIASQTRIIKRRRDYLADIQKLERLLTVMEGARIEIKKAAEHFDNDIVPFNFNVLPPSDDHPIYGKDEEKDDEEGAVQ